MNLTPVPTLTRLGFPIKKYDKYAEPVTDEVKEVKADETNKTSDAVSGFSIIEDYLKAIGGKAEVQKVTTLSSSISMEMMGREFTGKDIHMNPNKNLTELKMGAMTVMKMVFNGTAGSQQQGPGKPVDMTPAEVKEQQDDKGVIPQLFYNTADFKTEYLGKGKVNEEETYRLKVVMPSGRTSVQQYAIKTGLLLQEETTTKQGETEVPMTIEYKNYQKFGAILYPTQVTRNVSGQEFTINYSNVKINEGVTEADFK
jgi:zinc protease